MGLYAHHGLTQEQGSRIRKMAHLNPMFQPLHAVLTVAGSTPRVCLIQSGWLLHHCFHRLARLLQESAFLDKSMPLFAHYTSAPLALQPDKQGFFQQELLKKTLFIWLQS